MIARSATSSPGCSRPRVTSSIRPRTGSEALGRLDAGAYDIVLLDIGLPDISGLDVLAHARAAASPPIVIMMTADDTPETLLAAVREQAYRYIRKPFAPDTIVEVIDEAMARARRRRCRSKWCRRARNGSSWSSPCVLEMADRVQLFVMQLDTTICRSRCASRWRRRSAS